MLKLYNTLTRKKEIFKTRKKRAVNIFVCGPTVYDFSHLGHARTYIVYDGLVKFLKFQGYKVFYLQNITDIDDKIIDKAKKEKKNWKAVARFFEKEYLKDIKNLKINSVRKYARATEHIKEIISQVERLLKKGFAYQIDDGIYYDIKKFKEYGKLSGRTAEQAEDATSRIDEAKEKRNRGDFCLWKYGKSAGEYEPVWDTPFGPGRPGWHIEDTAIAEKYFGFQYDIHGGARELMFPHHEAEIAQMEAISGKKPMVRFWVHTGLLKIRGKKMAKSLGNFITIRDFLKKYQPEVLRFIVFSSHYRSPLDYSDNLAKEAQTNLEKLEEFLRKLQCATWKVAHSNRKITEGFEKNFFKALEEDFNTSKAKGLIFDFVSESNKKIDKNLISQKEAKRIYNFFQQINQMFGFLDFAKIEKKQVLPKEIKKLVAERDVLRSQKKWKEADKIRKEIEKMGFKIEDGAKAPIIKNI